MMLFRSATLSDLTAVEQLAEKSGIGITTLPKNRSLLQKRLEWSTSSFSQSITQPEHEYYFFVLEDTLTSQIVGTSAIESAVGYESPFYTYKLSKRTRMSHSLNIRSDYDVLNLVNDKQGSSEICTLFLDPDYRHNSNGLLLSKARFLFIAHYAERFSSTLIAEMRGISDPNGNSPFWDAVCSYFFQMRFPEADCLCLSTNKQFIADLMPRNPIYVKLIPPDAQNVIGKPHESTVPAMKILEREGFRYNDYVDIFDAGPTIEAPTDQIHSIRASRVMSVKNIVEEVTGKRYILSNTKLDFRAILGQTQLNEADNTCTIDKKTADALQIKERECLRLVPLDIE